MTLYTDARISCISSWLLVNACLSIYNLKIHVIFIKDYSYFISPLYCFISPFKSCWWYLKPLKTWISLLFTYQWQGQTQTLQFPFLMATHSSTLAWKIPRTEEPGRRQSMGSLRVGHDWVTSLSLFTFMRWRRKRQPTPVFLPGESQGWRSLVGCRLWGRTESDMTEAT